MSITVAPAVAAWCAVQLVWVAGCIMHGVRLHASAIILCVVSLTSVIAAPTVVGATPHVAKWRHTATVRLGDRAHPFQLVPDRRHHRLYVDTGAGVELVHLPSNRVIGRPLGESPGQLLPDLSHNRVYVLPGGDDLRPSSIRIVRGLSVLGHVPLHLKDPRVNAVVDPATGWLYADVTFDADAPSTLWIINGSHVLAKIPTGIESLPLLPLARDRTTGDILVPDIERDPSGAGPISSFLLFVHRTRVVRRLPINTPRSIVTRGKSIYVIGQTFDRYRDGQLVSSAPLTGDPTFVAVTKSGVGYVAGTGPDDTDVTVVQGNKVLGSVPGDSVYLDPSAEQGYVLSSTQVTVLSGAKVISTTKIRREPYTGASRFPAWFNRASEQMFVLGIHRTLVFHRGVPVRRLATGRSPCAAAGAMTAYVTDCARGRLSIWRARR